MIGSESILRFYYDCEFLEDGSTIAPISIGIVADDGREYYRVFADMPVERIASHPWLMANVVPYLPAASAPNWDLDRGHRDVEPRWRIAAEVRQFLAAHSGPVELWGYYSSYDHILLSQLWGRMIDRPRHVPMITLDVQQEAMRLGLENSLPVQVGTAHNALDDARWTREAWLYLAGKSAGSVT